MVSDGSPVPRHVCPALLGQSDLVTVRVGRVVISRPDHSWQQGARPNRRLFSLALMMDGSWAERRANISAHEVF
jgi:hypothetical protein